MKINAGDTDRGGYNIFVDCREGERWKLEILQDSFPGRAGDCYGVRVTGDLCSDTMWYNLEGVRALYALCKCVLPDSIVNRR